MSKDSIVEIPEGSGNKYRYSYQGGKTVYKGPVGDDAPALSEKEFKRAMEIPLTNNTYETSVVDPEVPPELYNPAGPHNPISWMSQAATMDGYEAVAKRAGVEPWTDEKVKKWAYGLRYASYTKDEWLSMSRDERVNFNLARYRLDGIEKEAVKKRTTSSKSEVVKAGCGHQVPRGSVMTTSRGTSCPDCYDDMSL